MFRMCGYGFLVPTFTVQALAIGTVFDEEVIFIEYMGTTTHRVVIIDGGKKIKKVLDNTDGLCYITTTINHKERRNE